MQAKKAAQLKVLEAKVAAAKQKLAGASRTAPTRESAPVPAPATGDALAQMKQASAKARAKFKSKMDKWNAEDSEDDPLDSKKAVAAVRPIANHSGCLCLDGEVMRRDQCVATLLHRGLDERRCSASRDFSGSTLVVSDGRMRWTSRFCWRCGRRSRASWTLQPTVQPLPTATSSGKTHFQG